MRGEWGSKAVWNISENSSLLETLPVPYGAFVCFCVIWRGEDLQTFMTYFLWAGRGVPKMTNKRSVILIEFGKSVNQVDVCAQNRLGALLSSRFHSLHLSQQFKDDLILKLEVLIKALSLLILCVVSRVNFMTIFSSMPLSLSQKIKFAHYWISDMGRKLLGSSYKIVNKSLFWQFGFPDIGWVSKVRS